MTWTEARITKLTELWEANAPTKEIGRIMRLTKNQVIGKAHRLGLEKREPPVAFKPILPIGREEAERILELWSAKTIIEIAFELGISRNRVTRMGAKLGLPAKSENRASSIWPPERVKTLTELHKSGLSHAEVGIRLGASAYAIKNKLSDLGLLRSAEPNVQQRRRGYIVPPKPRPQPLSRHHTCQFIAGEPLIDDACKCGEPAQVGSSYCPFHHAICWQPSPPRAKRAA